MSSVTRTWHASLRLFASARSISCGGNDNLRVSRVERARGSTCPFNNRTAQVPHVPNPRQLMRVAPPLCGVRVRESARNNTSRSFSLGFASIRRPLKRTTGAGGTCFSQQYVPILQGSLDRKFTSGDDNDREVENAAMNVIVNLASDE